MSTYVTILDYGGSGNGSTDNTSALNAAVNALGASGGQIIFPAGIYSFSSAISISLPNLKSVSLVGSGADSTVLYWGGSGGISFNYSTTTTSLLGSAHVSGMTFSNSGVNSGSAISLVNVSAAASNPANSALNSITDVTIRGQDGYAQANSWANGIFINGVSNVVVTRCNVTGSGATSGVGVEVVGTVNTPAVAITVADCNFYALSYGFVYGTYTQGVCIYRSNFTGCGNGIASAGSGVANLQLIVSACQFGYVTNGILLNAPIVDAIVSANLFLIDNHETGIYINTASGTVITGNAFSSNQNAGGNGVVVVATAAGVGGGIISGNSFSANLTYGVWLQAQANLFNVQSNYYHGVSTTVRNDAGAGNTIGGGSA